MTSILKPGWGVIPYIHAYSRLYRLISVRSIRSFWDSQQSTVKSYLNIVRNHRTSTELERR